MTADTYPLLNDQVDVIPQMVTDLRLEHVPQELLVKETWQLSCDEHRMEPL